MLHFWQNQAAINCIHKYGGRAEQSRYEFMNARLGRLETTWRTHTLVFHFGFVTRISHKILLKSSILTLERFLSY